MPLKIDYIYLSKDTLHNGKKINCEEADVIVKLTSGEKYVARFFTFNKIEKLRNEHKQSGEFLYGKYFWTNDMLLIENCEEANVREVINHLLEEGDFLNVFRRI